MKAEEFVKQHYPDAISRGADKNNLTFIWATDNESYKKLLGRGITESKAWRNAQYQIKETQFAVTATNPQHKRLQVALAKAAKEIGWKGLTAELACWCKKNQPLDTNYSLPWWCNEIKYIITKR